MIYVVLDGKIYRIDMSGRIDVTEVEVSTAKSGVLAKSFLAMDRPLLNFHYYVVSEGVREKVILSCGFKFLFSKKWRDEWDRLYRKHGGRKSGWGSSRVRRIQAANLGRYVRDRGK